MKTSRCLVWNRHVLTSRVPRRSPRAVVRLLRLSPLGAGVAVLAGLPAISAWAQSSGVAPNLIKPDGRTSTQQAVVGTRTDITTGTVKGDNAFNSFSRFEIGQGQTVNVHVPKAAQRVINIVTDAPIKVDGVLNGLKDGSISGNLVFADPMGMVVSKTGVINVNSLQVVAPSKTHLDAMMDGQGRIGDAAVKQLLDGQAPRSAEGRVQIEGKINALERVRIEARRIDVDGRIKAGADAAHDAAFRSAVSTNGLSAATGMVERGGVIELVADEGVGLKGQLDASQRVALSGLDAPQAGLGGVVSIRAEKIELGADSSIDVSGLSGGGVAVIGSLTAPVAQFSSPEGSTPVPPEAPNPAPLTQTLVVAKGSRVAADAIDRGDGGRIQYLSDGSTDWGGFASSRGGALMGHGGFVEVSGRRRAQVYGLVDTTAPKGVTGKLLIDPKHLQIANGEAGDSSCRNDGAAETCTLSTGSVVALAAKANLELLASDSISFAAGSTLDLYNVLTDPASQSISFTSTDITLNSEAKILTGGGSVKLNAGGVIWMAKDSAIITRGVGAADARTAELTSHAGDVSLQAKSIQLDEGSSILAHRVSSFSNYRGGKVELKASSATQSHMGLASASSDVTLAGTIKAERISVTADAKAEATPLGLSGYAIQEIRAYIGALTGMGAAYHETRADAKIDVQGTATLNATTTLDLFSNSANKAAGSVDVATVQEKGTTLTTVGAVVVRSAGLADVQVKSGATLQSGGKTTVAAYNDATAHGAVSLTSTNSESGLAVSYVDAKVSSNAQIDAGAIVQVGALDLLSLQTGNMRSTVDVKLMRKQPVDGQAPPTDAAIGSSVAISLLNVSSKATLGANVLGYDGVSKTGNVTVVSDASLSQNFSLARTQVVPIGVVDIGAAEKTKLFQPYAELLPVLLSSWLADKAELLKSGTNGFPLKASAVVTFNETDLSSAARIGNAAVVKAAGNVAVVAQTEDRAIHNIADSTVNTKNAKLSQPAGSAAVAVGQYEHNAEATVGEKAEVTGSHIGVQAHVFQPLDVTWLAGFNSEAWKAPSELFTRFSPPNFGIPEYVFTSWARAVAQQEPGSTNNAEAGAVAGAVNWTSFKNRAKSWLGAGAKVTAAGNDQPWDVKWTSPGDLNEATRLNQEAGFDKALQLRALNQSASLTLTGQPVDINGFNFGTQAGTNAAGGAFNYAAAQHLTVAGADDGAKLYAEAGSLALQADSQDRIIAVAPTAGKGGGVAANLIAAYSKLDNKTVAVLSSKAQVTAKTLDIAALEDVSVWSAAGAAAYGANQASVGIAVAVNELDGRTLAAIADPGSLAVGDVRPADFSASTGTGKVDAATVRVQADTQGSSGAISASAASVETGVDPNGKGVLAETFDKIKTGTEKLRNYAAQSIASDGDGRIAKFRNELAGAVSTKQNVQPKPPKQTSISLTGAASTSVNLGNLDTTAVLDGANLVNTASKAAGADDPSWALVHAGNETHQYAVSGTAALLKLNAPKTKAGYGVSGALAIDIEGNDTSASIVNSSLKDFGKIGVQSLASGQRISAGLGIAGSSGNKPSYMVSTSYSMTQSGNNTAAAIDRSTIEGSEAHRSAVEVLAYDKTETGVGAGALTVQGSEGGAVGASVVVGLVHNKVESRVAGVTASQLSSVDVLAYDPVVLGLGATSVGISAEDDANTLQASMVFAELENSTKAHIVDREGVVSSVKGNGAVTVQATDVVPDAIKTRVNILLAANGTPAADSSYDFGASLRAGDQDSFGGQSIGSSQPGALVIGAALGVAAGEGKTAGAATSASRVALVHEALVEGATVEAASLHVDATDAALVVNASLGVAGTDDKLAAIGSTSITVNDSRATARVGAKNKSTTITTTANTGLGVTAATRGRSFTLAGAVGVSLRGIAGGLAGSLAVDNSVGEALIQSATINTGNGAAQIDASTASQQINVAAAGGYGEKSVINGSYVINVAKARTSAGVSDSSITASSLDVTAGDSAGMASRVYTGAGSVGFSKDKAGGAAFTINTISQTREAAVERSTLTLASKVDALQVHAKSNAQMIGVGLAGGGAAASAFNGALSVNDLSNTTSARLTGSTLSTTGHVAIMAADRSEVDFGAGAFTVSDMKKALGAAIASTHIHGSITAELQGTDVAGQRDGTGVSSAGNVRVAASSDSKITNAAYGVAVGNQQGGTGSVAVNVVETNVTAAIGRGADLSADGSVAVEATAQDDIKSFGGALGLGESRGVGLSTTVNVVRGVTRASIGGDGQSARVKLDATGKGDGLQVNDGTLTQALPGVAAPGGDPSGFDGMDAMQRYDVTRGRMSEGRMTVKGVAVNATSMRHVLSFDTNAGGAADDVGLGANAGAHLIDAKTVAEVAHADINQRCAADSDQDVALKASSHHVLSTFGLSAGIGLSGAEQGGGWPLGTGAAAALGSDVFLTGTTASIRDSTVKAARDVKVVARNESAQSGILAGAAGGDRAFAGSVGVVVFDGDVEASILGGDTRAGRDVSVDADNSSTLNLITGTGGLSKGVVGAGALSVTVSDAGTKALIGRDSDASHATAVSSGGNIDVSADSVSQTNSFTLALGAGKDTSVAAIGAVNVITNSTTARVSQADLEVGVPANWTYVDSSSGGGSGGTASEGSGSVPSHALPQGILSVRATDHGLVKQISGAAGVSLDKGPGVGGTISVLVTKNNVTAEVKDSEVDTQDLKVNALNSQDQFAAAVGVGGSAQSALGFAISLTMTGIGSPGSDAFGSGGEAKGSQLMDKAASLANSDRLGETGEALSTQERSSVQAQSKRDLSSTLRAAGANSVTASVSNSTVRAAKDVSITSLQQTALKNIAGAVGLGLQVGIGGSVGVSFVRNASAAEAKGSTIESGGVIEITSNSSDKGGGKALDLMTMAGAAGGYVGLGASVGIAHLQNDVSAQGGGTLEAKQVSIKATDGTSAKAENVGAAVGKGAAGIAVASLDREGEVQAWFNKAGDSKQSVAASMLDIAATTAQQNEVKSLAVAAGLVGAGNGAAGLINDRIKVIAGIGDASKIQVGGAVLAPNQRVNVLATRGASLDSRADGLGVAVGLQIGASVSQSNMGGETAAQVGDNVEFDNGSTLVVKASENANNLIKASSTASGGGLLLGASAADARVRNTAAITASIGDNTKLPDGAVMLLADHAATQAARSLGVTMGGVLALGSNVAKAETGASIRSTLGNVKTNVWRLGDLDVRAKGVDTTTAQATAGGGALISGHAAQAEVKDDTHTSAKLSAAGASALGKPDDYIVRGGALSFDARHEAQVRADADSVNASVLGGSGANAKAQVDTSVASSLGAGVRVEGLNIRVNASNKATETGSGDNAAGASGGVFDGSAVLAQTSFSTSSKAEVGKDAQLDVIGDPGSDSAGLLAIVASTDLQTYTAGSLNTGGLIASPKEMVESTTVGANTVTIGEDAKLRSAGDLILGTSALNVASATALVKTYGAVGITGGTSSALAKQTDKIDVQANALLNAYGNISLANGRSADTAMNRLKAQAQTDVYTNTVVPISYTNGANAATEQRSSLDLAAGSQVQAGRSVYLRASKADESTLASGKGHNPYLDLFSTSKDQSNPEVPLFEGAINVQGKVTAGYYRLWDLTIESGGTLSQRTPDTPDTKLPVRVFTMDEQGRYLSEGKFVDAAEALRPIGYIAKIVGFNPSKYYTADAKLTLGKVPDAQIGAYVLPDLVAAGGNIEVDAKSLAGNGSLRAQGGPQINVNNGSEWYLIGNQLVIPESSAGGNVSYTGSARKPDSLTVLALDPGGMPSIKLANTRGEGAGDIVIQAVPGVTNALRNASGNIDLINASGNVWAGGYEALNYKVDAPKGTAVIRAEGYWSAGGSPQSIWWQEDQKLLPKSVDDFINTAAYAYYRDNLGGASIDNEEYSRVLQGIKQNLGNCANFDKRICINGYLFNQNLGNVPDRGASLDWYDGRYYFDTLRVMPLTMPGQTPGGTPSKPGGRSFANTVNIAADYIDVNSDIRAGNPKVDVTITNKKIFRSNIWDLSKPRMGFFDCVADEACRTSHRFKLDSNGVFTIPSDYGPDSPLVFGANSAEVRVTYNPKTGLVSLDPIGTPSVGSITLNGKILNSNPDGRNRSKIELVSGPLDLNINNQSGYALDLPRIESGAASGQGVIKITDHNRTAKITNKRGEEVEAPLTTWWVSKDGGAPNVYQSYSESDYKDLTPTAGTQGASTTAYDPLQGQRYQWTRTATATRAFAFNGGDWWNAYAGSWSFAFGAQEPTWTPAVSRVIIGSGDGSAYSSGLTQDTTFGAKWLVRYKYPENQDRAQRIWNIATQVTLTQTSSIRADYGIDVGFSSSSTAGVVISSNADTYLGKPLNNPGGSTTLKVTKNLFADGGSISTGGLVLDVGGDIRGVGKNQALRVSLSDHLYSVSGGSTAIESLGTLRLAGASVGDGQQLRLSAIGDITSTSNDVTLKGYDVRLSSTGRVGGPGVGDPLNIEVKGIGAAAEQRGLLTVTANRDINLNLTGGDTRVVEITAADGNVFVNSKGSLFDGQDGQGRASRSESELQQLWEQTLKISGDKTASVLDYYKHTITPLDQQVNRDYRDYWTLRSLGSLGADGKLTLSAEGLSKLRAQTAAVRSVSNPTDAEVNDWANTLLSRYTHSFDIALGESQWKSQAAFQSKDSTYRFSADRYNEYWTLKNATVGGQLTAAGRDAIRQMAATVIGSTPSDEQLQAYVNQRFAALVADFGVQVPGDKLTSYDPSYQFSGDTLLGQYAGTYWGAERLQNSIRSTAFGEPGGGTTAIDHLNISGRKVSVNSSAAKGTLGRNNPDLYLFFGNALSDEQRYALSQAMAPGDVQLMTDTKGKPIGLKVKDIRPLFVEAKSQFDATARGSINVQALGGLAIGKVQSLGNVRLLAQDGITNAGPAWAIKGSSLVLVGGTGSLGTEASALSLDTPELSLARAGGSIWLSKAAGDLVIDAVNAGKDVNLRLGAGNLNQKQKGLLSLAADRIVLDVNGNIGTDPQGAGTGALVLALDDSAVGDTLKINARDTWLSSASKVRLGDSRTRAFSLNLTGAADLAVTGDVASSGKLTWLVGGDFNLSSDKKVAAEGDLILTAGSVTMDKGGELLSHGNLALYSGSDAVLGSLTAKTGMTLDVEGGSLKTNAVDVLMTVQDEGAGFRLNSLNMGGAGVGGVVGGADEAALRVAADVVSVRSATGDVHLDLRNAATELQASTLGVGGLFAQAAGRLRVSGDVQTGQDLVLTSQEALTLDAARTMRAGAALKLEGASLTMGVGSQAISDTSTATLIATDGDARLSTVRAKTGMAIDAARGRVMRVGAADLLSVSDAGGLIALNQSAGNTGGLGLGEALRRLELKADRSSARNESGGIFLNLSGANSSATQLETVVAGTGDIVLSAAGDLSAAGPISTTGNVNLTSLGALTSTGSIEALGASSDLNLQATRLDLAASLLAGRNATLEALSSDLLLKKGLSTGGDVVLGSLTSTRAQDVQAGRDLLLGAGGPIKGDRLHAWRDLTVWRGSDVNVRELSSGASMSLTLDAINNRTLDVGGGLSLAAGRAILGDVGVDGSASLTVQNAFDATLLEVGQTLNLSADRARALTVKAGGAASFRTVGDIDINAGTFNSTLNLRAKAARLYTGKSLDEAAFKVDAALVIDSFAGQKSLTIDVGSLDAKTLAADGAAQLSTVGAARISAGQFGSTLDMLAGSATLGSIAVAGDAQMAVKGSLQIDKFEGKQAATLKAASLAAKTFAAQGAAKLNTTGDVTLNTASFGGTLDLKSNRAILGLTTVAADATVASADLLRLTSFEGKRALDMNVGRLDVQTLKVSGNATLSSLGNAAIKNGTFGAALKLSAEAATLGTVSVLDAAQLATNGALQIDSFEAKQALTLAADSLSAKGLSAGASAKLSTAGKATIDKGVFATELDLRAANATLGQISMAGDSEISTSGMLAFTDLDARKALRLQAANIQGGVLKVGDAAVLGASEALQLNNGEFAGNFRAKAARATLGQVQSRGEVDLNIDATLDIQNLSAGGNLAVNADAITAQRLAAGRALSVQGREAQIGETRSGSSTSAVLGQQLILGRASVGTDLSLSTPSLKLDQLDAQGQARLTVDGAATLGQIDAGQQLALRADSLVASRLAAGQSLELSARSADVGVLGSGGNALLRVAQTLALGGADVQGALDLAVASSRISSLKVAGDAKLVVDDKLALLGQGNIVGGTLDVQARDLELNELRSLGAAKLSAGNRLSAELLRGDATLSLSARSAQLQVQAGGDTSLMVTDDLGIGGIFGAALSVQTASLEGSSLIVAGKTSLAARDTLVITNLAASQAADIKGGAVNLGQVSLGDKLTLVAAGLQGETLSVAANANIDIAGAAQLKSLDTGALRFKAEGLKLASLNARGTAQLSASQGLQIDALKSSDALDLKATNVIGSDWNSADLTLDAGGSASLGRLNSSGDATLSAGTVLSLAQGQIGKNLSARASQIQFGELSVGGDASLQASGAIEASRLKVEGKLEIQSGAQLHLGSVPAVKPLADTPVSAAVQVGGTARLDGDTLSLADLKITGAASLSARGSLSLLSSNEFKSGLEVVAQQLSADRVNVGDKANFKVANQLEMAQFNASNADLSAASLKLGNFSVSDSLNASAARDIVADALTAAKRMTLNAGGGVQAKLLQTQDLVLSGDKEVNLDLLKARSATLRSATQIALAEAQGASFTLQAPQIQGALKFVPVEAVGSESAAAANTLSSTLTGLDGSAAKQITLSASFEGALAQRWSIPALSADTISLTTNGHTTQIDKGRVSDSMRLGTPDGLIGLMAGKAKVWPNVDVQLFTPSSEFSLVRDRQYVDTDAMALVYKPSQIVSAANTGRTPQDAHSSPAGGTSTRSGPSVRQAALGVNFDQLLRSSPTKAGKEEDDGLVGKLEF